MPAGAVTGNELIMRRRRAMQVHSHLLVATAITVTLLTACGERAEDEPATPAPAAASETAENAEATGTTTNFEDSSPSEEQKQPPG